MVMEGVVKLLVCGAQSPGSEPRLIRNYFRDWVALPCQVVI